MVNAHEINLGVTTFEQFRDNNYIIVQVGDIEVNDYILFRQVEGEAETPTGLFSMTQVKRIVQDKGLKDGYALLVTTKLS